MAGRPVRSVQRGASNLTGRSNVRTTEAAKDVPRVKRIAGDWECRAGQISAKAYVDTAALELIGIELPVVREDGMPGRNGQRKPGTTRGSPRRSRTAKAAHISRRAMKLCCACEWGAWGRLSVDGSGQHNPNRSEDPWSRATLVARMAVLPPSRWPPTLSGGPMLPRRARRMEANLITRR